MCESARGIGYIAEAVSVLPGIQQQFKELPGTVREMALEKLPDEVRHLLQGDRACKRPGLAQQCRQVVLELERPVALPVKPLMNGKLLPVEYHRKPVGIELYGDFTSHQTVGNGVAVAFDAYRRPFVNGIFHGLEASHVSGPGAHRAEVSADFQLFLGGVAERDLGVHLSAYRVEMCLGLGQRRIMT